MRPTRNNNEWQTQRLTPNPNTKPNPNTNINPNTNLNYQEFQLTYFDFDLLAASTFSPLNYWHIQPASTFCVSDFQVWPFGCNLPDFDQMNEYCVQV